MLPIVPLTFQRPPPLHAVDAADAALADISFAASVAAAWLYACDLTRTGYWTITEL